jgi:Zn-dependent protease/predicted transcriptional regulator
MLRTNIRLFKVLGIPVEINVSWFIIFALVAWSLVSLYFPTNYRDYSTAAHWIMGIVAAILLFVSVVLHELGHSYVAKTHGVPIRRITLFLFGGVSQLTRESPNPATELKIAVAGPAVSFLLGGICGALYFVTSGAGALGGVRPVLKYLAIVNVMLGGFNLIPGFPLDGGRLLRAILWKATGNLRRATYVATRVGSILGIVFVAFGFLAVFRGDFVYGLWMVMIGLFLRQAAEAGYFQVLVDGALKGMKVHEVMKTDVVTVPETLTLQSLVDDYFFKHHYDCFPVADAGRGRLLGLVTLNEVKHVPKERWGETTVADVMQRGAEELSVSPDDDVSAVLRRVIKDQCGRLPVVERGAVVGIVTRKDIMEALRVLSDLDG